MNHLYQKNYQQNIRFLLIVFIKLFQKLLKIFLEKKGILSIATIKLIFFKLSLSKFSKLSCIKWKDTEIFVGNLHVTYSNTFSLSIPMTFQLFLIR